MPRIRTIKPEMCQDEDLATCSCWAQLLAIRILNFADDEGYFKANPVLVKASCFPLIDDQSLNVRRSIDELSSIGYLEIKVLTNGKEYGRVVNFSKHQRIDRKKASTIRELWEFDDQSTINRRSIDDMSHQEGKGREGKGEGKPPDPKLDLEPDDPTDSPTAKTRAANGSRFRPPSLQEVEEYIAGKGYSVDAEQFISFYSAKGWMIGKNKMKCWHSAISTWQRRQPSGGNGKIEMEGL